MSRSAKSWIIATVLLVAIGVLAAVVILHDASASPAEALTGRALQALGMPSAATKAPHIVFGEGGLGPVSSAMVGDTLVVSFDAGETTLNQDKTTTLAIANEGSGPLTMQLYHVSCACFRHIKLNGHILGLRDGSATLHPGESAVLQITLKSDPDEIRVEELPKEGRFGITFNINSPTASKMRVEATSRLVPGEVPKKAQAK